MSKSTIIAAVALSSALAFGAAVAGGPEHHPAADHNFHYGVSAIYKEANSLPGAAIGFEAQNRDFEAGLSFNVFRSETSANARDSYYGLGAHVGFRHELQRHVSAAVGLAADYTFAQKATVPANKRPYAVGAYVGAEFMAAPHTEVFARIMPVNYIHDESRTDYYEFFSAGQIGVSYFF